MISNETIQDFLSLAELSQTICRVKSDTLKDLCITILSLRSESNLLRKELEAAREMISHALTMDIFTPGGSTECWAKEVITRITAFLEGEK